MSSRAAVVLVLALGAALLGGLGWVLLGYDPPAADLSWRLVGFQAGDPEQIRVTFEVEKDPGREARCRIAAFEDSGKSAGRLNNVVIPRSADRVTRLTVVVPTEEEATRAQVAECVFVG